MSLLQRGAMHQEVHLGCLPAIEQRRAFARAQGVSCLFCGANVTLGQLIAHVQRHATVIPNW